MSTLRHRVIQYNPANGTRIGLGPVPRSLEAGAPFNDTSSLSVEFGDPTNVIRAPAELAVELSTDGGTTWVEPSNMRFCVIADSRDRVTSAKYPKLKAVGMFWQLKKAVVCPESGPFDADGRRTWSSVTPGALIRTLIQEAQNRGVLSWLDMSSFSSTLDSNGTAWPATFSTSHEIGVTYDSIVIMLADVGLIDFVMVGRSLKVYVADTYLMPAATAITLTQGSDFTEATEDVTYELVASRNVIKGDGVSTIVTDAAADKPWGEWEVTTSASGSTSIPDLNLLADLGSARSSLRQTQRTVTVYPNNPNSPKPFFDYVVGSKLATFTDSTYEANLRVRQITLRCDGSSILATLVLGDRLLEREVRLQRLLKAASGGIAGAGAGGTFPSRPPAEDTLAPSPPTGIGFSSTAVLINDAVIADLTVSWTAPTTNTDATILDDLDHYELQIKRTVATVWSAGGMTDAVTLTVPGLVPGAGYDVRVRAVDKNGNASTWLTGSFTTNMDGAAPNTPSTPTVVAELGTLFVYWNGKDNLGNNPPSDFKALKVYISTTSGFTVGPSTYVDAIASPTGGRVPVADLVYGTTYFVKTTMIDTSGNESGSSVQASGIPVRVTGLDIDALTIATSNMGDLAITTAKIADLAVLNAKIANLAVDDAKVANVSVGKLTAGTLSADITVSARIKTANTGARVELNTLGFEAYNSSNNRTFFVDSSNGNVTTVGAFQTGLTARRMIIDATGYSTLAIYPATGSNYAYLNGPDSGSSVMATIGINSSSWTSADATTVRTRCWVHTSGANFSVFRDSDQVRYGGYVDLTDYVAQMGMQKAATNPNGYCKVTTNDAEITVIDSGGLKNTVYATDGDVGVNTDPNDDPFNIQLGDGTMYSYGRNANMGTLSGYGMFLHGESSISSQNNFSVSFGYTMVSQIDVVLTVETSTNTTWSMTVSSSTSWGWQSQSSISGQVDWHGIRR